MPKFGKIVAPPSTVESCEIVKEYYQKKYESFIFIFDHPYNKMFRFIVFIHKALQLLFGVGQVLQFGHSKCFRYLFQPSRNVDIKIRQECKCLSEKNKNY